MLMMQIKFKCAVSAAINFEKHNIDEILFQHLTTIIQFIKDIHDAIDDIVKFWHISL